MALQIAWLNRRYRSQNVYFALLGQRAIIIRGKCDINARRTPGVANVKLQRDARERIRPMLSRSRLVGGAEGALVHGDSRCVLRKRRMENEAQTERRTW